jgi:hypothetical protein
MKSRKIRRQERDERRLSSVSRAVEKTADLSLSPLMRLSLPGAAESAEFANGAGGPGFIVSGLVDPAPTDGPLIL